MQQERKGDLPKFPQVAHYLKVVFLHQCSMHSQCNELLHCIKIFNVVATPFKWRPILPTFPVTPFLVITRELEQ